MWLIWTWLQSLFASYQRLKKWYLMPPCLTLSNIRYVSRVKWSNPGKGVAPFPTPRCSSYWKGSLLVALDCGRQIYLQLKLAVNEIWALLSHHSKQRLRKISFFSVDDTKWIPHDDESWPNWLTSELSRNVRKI